MNESLYTTRILHLVRPEDLNHHGTLFAGQMARWLVEAGLIAAARLCGRPHDVVCVRLDDMKFKRPINSGDIIEINSRIAHLGSSSITVFSEIVGMPDRETIVSNMAVFVTVDEKNRPYKHGLSLSDEYIAANRDLHAMALTKRELYR